MISESNRLDKQITLLQTQIKSLPEGKLVCTRNQNRYKWYQSDGHKCTYLPKSQRSLAEKLAIKKYLSLIQKDSIAEKRAIQFYYWEHFGMMDHPNYSKKVPPKLDLYISNGIIPFIKLITTYETKDDSLSFEVINKLIEHYFL